MGLVHFLSHLVSVCNRYQMQLRLKNDICQIITEQGLHFRTSCYEGWINIWLINATIICVHPGNLQLYSKQVLSSWDLTDSKFSERTF